MKLETTEPTIRIVLTFVFRHGNGGTLAVPVNQLDSVWKDIKAGARALYHFEDDVPPTFVAWGEVCLVIPNAEPMRSNLVIPQLVPSNGIGPRSR